MMKMRKWNTLLISLLILINSGYLLKLILSNNESRILVTLSLYLTIWIPRIVRSTFKVKIPEYMELVYLIFIFLAQFLGSIVGLYTYVYWFDSFVHFISGVLTSIFGIAILHWFSSYDSKKIIFNIFFMIAFTLMVASMWEMFEFTLDLILNGDTQNVVETGVADTMVDMIVALLGSLLVSVYYWYEKKCNKKQFFNRYEGEF